MNLLIDFGASHLKAYLSDSKTLNNYLSIPAVEPVFYSDGRCEVNAVELMSKFKYILRSYEGMFDKIFLCTEMHGFILMDNNNKSLTDYISWRDERSLNFSNPPLESYSGFEVFNRLMGKSFKEITGMKIRCGLPVANLFYMEKCGMYWLEDNCKISTLSDWLSTISNQATDVSHETMLCGLGFHNLQDGYVSESITWKFDNEFTFNTSVQGIDTAGYYHSDNIRIPIYTGVGDFQCAVLGAGNTENTIGINLGTGSQIAVIRDKVVNNKNTESRPFFNEKYLECITHIPSGRALNEYINFISSIKEFSILDTWDNLQDITLDEINKSTLKFDLAIFNQATNFKGFEGISNIKEGSLNLINYLASLLKSYVDQYIRQLQHFELNLSEYTIILSGGIAKRLPVLTEYLKQELKIDVRVSEGDTLEGLRILSEDINE